MMTIQKANQIRSQADPDLDPDTIILRPTMLPPIGTQGIADMETFWMNVINLACSRGGRMIGSLLLAAPHQVTDYPGSETHNEIVHILRSLSK